MNAGRFVGKGVDDEAWEAVFVYYMDLWLAQLAISTARMTFGDMPELVAAEPDIVNRVVAGFDDFSEPTPTGLEHLEDTLRGWQRELDLEINNAALTRCLDHVTIRVARGRLPLAVPQAFAAAVPVLGGIVWMYLLDELENLTEPQQRYVQTLIREKEPPASFMVGSRLYGFRTRRTFSADEENKEGSEFDALRLDRFYLEHDKAFGSFCRLLVAQRLIEEGSLPGQRDTLAHDLDQLFERLSPRDSKFVVESDGPRKYFAELKSQLAQHTSLSKRDIATVIEALSVTVNPLLEKLNVLLLYQGWNARKPLLAEAKRIEAMCSEWRAGATRGHYAQKVKHHESDMLAQLLRQYSQQQRYLGVDSFIDMAGGLPRNLLIILKNVYRWAEFNGEHAFNDEPISAAAQRKGVQEASAWFLKDNLPMGDVGERVDRAINQLGGLLRALRFADRPPEIRLSAFSVDSSRMSRPARETLTAAEQSSMLLEDLRGQRDRNDASVVRKYRLNPMLCPHFDLPLTLGGALRLNVAEGEALFGESESDAYHEIRKIRLDRATVPFRPNGSHEQIGLLSDST